MSRAPGRVMPTSSGCHITFQIIYEQRAPTTCNTANELDWAPIRRLLTTVGQEVVCLRCAAGAIRMREVVASTDEPSVGSAGVLAREVRVRVVYMTKFR